MIEPTSQFRKGHWSTDVQLDWEDGESGHCEWKHNGPLLYTLEHSVFHADGEGLCSVSPCLFLRFE